MQNFEIVVVDSEELLQKIGNIKSPISEAFIKENYQQLSLRRLLDIPEYMRIAYAIRLGYPISPSAEYLRVRRDLDAFVHDNRFGNR